MKTKYVPVHLKADVGLARTGWYVRDITITSCVVLLGGPHMLRIQAQGAADAANRTGL